MNSPWPRRIACITSETTEMVFALGAGDRIVGVSGFASRPPEARAKEKVSTFTSINMEKIREVAPDLILGFSDLQAGMAKELIENSYNVFISNQRTLAQTGETLLAIARLIGEEEKGRALHDQFFSQLHALERETKAALAGVAPKVYFEEWDEPLICGISWVSELIEKLGGQDVFKSRSVGRNAKDRNISPEEVIVANPEIMIASWCGKKVQFDKVRARAGWEKIDALRNKQLFEIKSADILTPGLSLIHGARQMAEIFQSCVQSVKSAGNYCG